MRELIVVGSLIFALILLTFFTVFFSIIQIQALSALSYCIYKICTAFLFFPFYFLAVFLPTLYYCHPQTISDFHPHPFFFGGLAIHIFCSIIVWITKHQNPWGDFVAILNSIFKESDVIKFQHNLQYVGVATAFFIWEITALAFAAMRQKECAEFVVIVGTALILIVFSIFMLHRKDNAGKLLLGVTLALLLFSFVSIFVITNYFEEIAYVVILILSCLIGGYSVNVIDLGFINFLSTTINTLTTLALLVSNIIFSEIFGEAQFAFNIMTLPFLALGTIMSCRTAFKSYLSPKNTIK